MKTMPTNVPRITVDSDMEESAEELSDAPGGQEESVDDLSDTQDGQEVILNDFMASPGIMSSKSIEEIYEGLEASPEPPASPLKAFEPPNSPIKPPLQYKSAVESYPVYQPSPKLVDPIFVASAQPREAAPQPGTSKRRSRLWLWIVAVCIILLLAIVPPILVNSKTSAASSSSQDAANGAGSSQNGSGQTGTNNSNGSTTGKNNGSNTGTSTSGGATNTNGSPHTSSLLAVIQSVTSPQVLANTTTAQAKAAKWLLKYESSYDYQGSDINRLQRYVLSVLGFSMFPSSGNTPLFGNPHDSECDWLGVTCGEVYNSTLAGAGYWTLRGANMTTNSSSGIVTELFWPEQNLTGNIPTEIALLSSLEYLDLADNSLTGSLPEEIFSLVELQRLYVQGNQLQGTLSESFSNLGRLASFYGGNNQFTGPIPQGLGSPGLKLVDVRPLRK
jgi:hypothetical protein